MPTLRDALQFDTAAIAERDNFVLTVKRSEIYLAWWRFVRRYTLYVMLDDIARPRATRVFRRLEDLERYIARGNLPALRNLDWWPVHDGAEAPEAPEALEALEALDTPDEPDEPDELDES